MQTLVFVLLIALLDVSLGQNMLVTKEYTDYLKRHVSWKVVDYEENVFRGWTMEEAKNFLGAVVPMGEQMFPSVQVQQNLPSNVNWAGSSCDHGVRNQAACGSCWAFATVGMLSDRCCLQGHDHGWLSVQYLISCDRKDSGCEGGWCSWALETVMAKHGLPTETCFPYQARNVACPEPCRCEDGSRAQFSCDCKGGFKTCATVAQVRTCLQSGPTTVSMGVCRSLFNYREGVYECDCDDDYIGFHAVLAMGYSDSPKCNYHVKNSWGVAWGAKGYFDIACDSCGISGTYPNGNVMCETVGP